MHGLQSEYWITFHTCIDDYFILLCSVCTSVILGGNDDLAEEESRLHAPWFYVHIFYLFSKDYFRSGNYLYPLLF